MTDKNETANPPKEEPQPAPPEEQKQGENPQNPNDPSSQPQSDQQQAQAQPAEAAADEKKAEAPADEKKDEVKRPGSKGKKTEKVVKDAGKDKKGRPKSKTKNKKTKANEQAEKEAEEKRLEELRLEEERKKKEEEERLKKEEEERLRKEEEERLRLEELEKQKEEEDDKRLIYLVNLLVENSFIKDINDPRLTDEIVDRFSDFLDLPEKDQLYLKFNEDETKLIVKENILELYDPTENKNAIDSSIPPGSPGYISKSDYDFCFFLKKKHCRIGEKNIANQIVFDKMDGSVDKYILDKMNNVLSDRIYTLNWPEGIKNDLISKMHKFLITLNKSYFQELNKVVLYIPRENLSSEANKDKELVTRLEDIMKEWTDQIRDFLSNQDNASNREDFDVNEEITYLEGRNSNLAAISEQLENRDLQDIVNILGKNRSNSENLKGFVDLQKKILDQRTKTFETHKYLKILKNPCDKIRNPKTEIKEIKPIIIEIMNKIRVITEFCDTYKLPEDVANLLKKVSFQLIHKFTQKIQENDKNIMTEYNEKLYQNILDINRCIADWISIYYQFKDRIKLFEKNDQLKEKWKLEKKDYQIIFYELETFKKRCDNLEEICLYQLQFGKDKNSSVQPIWGGTKRMEISKQLKDIEEKFDDKMYLLFKSGNNVLNTKVNKWQEEFRIFSKYMEDLEDMYKNTISSAFKRVKTLEEAVNYVENFYSLAKVNKIKNYIKNDVALEVILIYYEEMQHLTDKNNAKNFTRMNMQTTEGGNTLWAKYVYLRIEDYEKLIAKMNQILVGKNSKEELQYEKNKKMDDLRKEIRTLKGTLKSYLQGDANTIQKNEIELLNKVDPNKLTDSLRCPLITSFEPQNQFNQSTKMFFQLYQCNYPPDLMLYGAIVNCYSRFEEFSIAGDTVKYIKELEIQKRRVRELVINACREYNQLVSSVKKDTERTIFQEEFNKLNTENIVKLQNNYWNQQGGFDKGINQVRTKVKEMSKMINEFKSHSKKIDDICEQISKKLFFHIEKNSDIYNKNDFIAEQELICKETSDFIQEKAEEIVNLLMQSYKFISHVKEVKVFEGFKSYIEEISKKGFNDALERALTNSIITMHRAMLGEGNNSYLSSFFRVDILLSEGKFKKNNYVFEPTEQDLRQIINDTVQRMKTNAENAPDIYNLFVKVNPEFEQNLKNPFGYKKTDKNVNSLNAIKEENQEANQEADKGKKGKKGKKGDKGKQQRALPSFLHGAEKAEKKDFRFPKAEEAKKVFNSDLKNNCLDKVFFDILTPWLNNQRLQPFQQMLQESENVRKIDGVFKGFLQEGNSDQLISALNDYIIELNRLKTDDLSNTESTDIPPTIVSKLFIQFNSSNVKSKLIELCEGIISYDLKYITEKTRKDLIDKVNQDFNEHQARFKKEPDTQDDWKQLWDELKQAEAEKEDRFKKITGANDVVHRVIGGHQVNRPNEELFKEVEELEKRKEKYTALLEDAKKMLQDARTKLISQVLDQEKKFISDVEEMQRKFNGVIPDKLECKLQEEQEKTYEAQKILKKYSDKCEALEKEEKSVAKGLNLFIDILKKTPVANKILLDFRDQIKELNKIWSIKSKMNEIVKKWRETQFYDFDLEEMEKERFSIENRLRVECKESNKRPIYITMKEQLDLYNALIQVLVLLRDDAMSKNSQSHWEKVQNTLGLSSLDPMETDFNFEKIIELKLELYREPIEKIVKYAREQLKLDQGLEAIKDDWKVKELKYEFKNKGENNNDGDFRLLPENKAWVDALESHLAKIAEYKSTPYYEDFKEKIDNLENELNKFSDLYQLLKQVQDKRNYLKNIFSKDIDDIYQQAGNDIAVYKTNNEKFLEICSTFDKNKLVQKCFLQEGLEVSLNDLLYKFSDVERSMNSLLDTKRQTFKRFYFLSNDDLFELMGNSFDMKVINPHLTKLFTGVERIKIEPGKKKDENPTINFIYDSMDHGEKFKLNSSVIVISMVETWMNDLEKAMISSLENNLSKAYRKFLESPKSLELDLDNNPDIKKYWKEKVCLSGQSFLTLTNFAWRINLEKKLIDASKNDKTNVDYETEMANLTTCVTKAAAYLDKRKLKTKMRRRYIVILYNYILLMKYLYELTSNLKNENVRGIDNYEWQKLLKVNFANKKDILSQNMFQRNRTKNITEEKFIVQIEQLQNKANYGYEYIGNKERLVITPVTERCFLNMMTAIFYFRGGALQGPAGTGKTETIKDLSRAMAKYVIVFNCSNKNSYNTMATLFLGVINTGAWVCFDEFNRIEVEVLSVIRIQLITIFDALKAKKISIPFKGNAGVRINHSLAIYITMNPQYIFRTELPENLKILFRPVALKAADRQRICEIRFLADGSPANIANNLAKLLIVSLDVLMQQLSPQSHYDFSLRAIMNILKYASTIKNIQGHDETFLLRMAICDMLKPKLVANDEEVFDNVLSSVFNDGLQGDGNDLNDQIEKTKQERQESLRIEVKQIIELKKLTGSPFLVNQVIQLYNNMNLKHGLMLVGGTLSGKTTSLDILKKLNEVQKMRLDKKKDKNQAGEFTDVEIRRIFPKSIELDELYGRIGSDGQYNDGLLPYHLKDISNSRYDDENTRVVKWLVLDSPVDTLWIESLNTLLDETRMLSLPSGFRINLKRDIKVVFEAEELTQATPATISRVGLIFFEQEKLSWFPIARKWLDAHKDKDEWYEYIAKWFDKYVYGILEELETMNLGYLCKMSPNQIVTNLIKIYDAFISDLNSINPYLKTEEEKANNAKKPADIKNAGKTESVMGQSQTELKEAKDGQNKDAKKEEEEEEEDDNGTENTKFWEMAERLFVFALMWAIGGPLGEQGRIKVDNLIRKYSANFPANTLIFDFFVNPDKDDWATWDEKMIQGWTPNQNSLYSEIFVPTVDITRNRLIIINLLKNNQNPFILGGIATGKSSIIKMIYNTLELTKYQPFNVNLSYGISSKSLQKTIEIHFEKRNNKLYPPSNKKSLCYVDDLNLPKEDQFGSKTIVEMLRQFMELEGWYSVDTLNYVNIKSMLLLVSTCIRNADEQSNISQRFLSKFIPMCIQSPNDQVKKSIFSTILAYYLSSSQSEDVKKLNDGLAMAVIGLYNAVTSYQDFQPTPSKCYFIFNMHDITKIFEAISKVSDNSKQGGSYYTKEYFVKIFTHESFRTFSDRFLSQEDKSHFKDFLSRQIETHLGMSYNDTLTKDQRECIFIDPLPERDENGNFDRTKKPFEEYTEFEELKKTVLSRLDLKHRYKDMVFFDNAIYNVFFLRRIIYKSVGGHGILIGLGSAGRTSYVKIASDLCGYEAQIFNGAKDCNEGVWLDFIKKMIREVAGFNKQISLVIKERDHFCQLIIEHVHYLISIGFVPNLYSPGDWEEIKTSSASPEIQSMSMEAFQQHFIKNIKENLRIFMTFSPYGDKLKDYVRKYPSIIDHTTCLSFTDWPEAALKEVANKKIKMENLIVQEAKKPAKKEEVKQEEKKEENKEENGENPEGNTSEEETKEAKIAMLLAISDIFAQIHLGVSNNVIEVMKREMKREAYFTSQNFITLIDTFNQFLTEKVKAINLNIEKYRSGIEKIQIGKTKIDEMKIELEDRSKIEAIKNRENQKLLDEIQEKQKNAVEQENDVKFQREKNAKNKEFFEKNKRESEREMNLARVPMLEAIKLTQEKITRKKLSEFKAAGERPKETKEVFYALMAIFGKPQTWETVKTYLQTLDFNDIQDVEHLPVTEKGNFPTIQKYSRNFDLAVLKNQSELMPDLAMYIQNVEKYFKAKWVAEVKQKNFMEANKKVLESMKNLERLEKQLEDIKNEIANLQRQLNEGKDNLNRIKAESENIKAKLGRASNLANAFAKEEERWGHSLKKNQELLKNVLGDIILASGYLTYLGVFPEKYRGLLKNEWADLLKKKGIAFNPKFDFLNFISNANEIQNWKIFGLPDDVTMVENAVIMKYSLNPSLIIDPQDQAIDWIKNMLSDRKGTIIQEKDNENENEGSQSPGKKKGEIALTSDRHYVEVTTSMNAYLLHIREAMNAHKTVIINNIGEFLPPELEEFLKSFEKKEYQLYLRTKVPNPKFSPEVSTSVNIINFLVNDKGLEEQILSAVVKIEREDSENNIRINIKKMFETQKELDICEEDTLTKLNEAGDNYLDDDQLITKLESSTKKSTENQKTIAETSQEIEKINASREEYRPLARKVSKYFFVLYQMNSVNNMYEFSLKHYITLFEKSVKSSVDQRGGGGDSSEDRIKSIEKVHLERVISYANQCLFEKDKLLFAFQLCLETIFSNDEEQKKDLEKKGLGKYISQQNTNNNNLDEDNPQKRQGGGGLAQVYDFFNIQEFSMLLSNDYGHVDDKMVKPSWINDQNAWSFLVSLEKIPDLKGIVASISHNSSDWHKWYQNKEIEELPVEWETKCKGTTNIRKLLFIKALRPDKIANGIRDFIENNLEVELKQQVPDLSEIVQHEITPDIPLLIVHGGGVEPSDNILQLWDEIKEKEEKEKLLKEGEEDEEENKDKEKEKEKKKKEKEKKEKEKGKKENEEEEIKPRCVITTLNQDQWPLTHSLLIDMAKVGGWVYVANTHLTLQGIPQFEKTLDDIKSSHPHPNFRIIISTNPHPNYPISLLQRCNKITFELPHGIGNNMALLFDDLSKEAAAESNQGVGNKYDKADNKATAFAKMVYSLAMFHSMLLERRKYKGYGWTKFYDFNNSDFKICLDILKTYSKKFITPQDFPWKAIQELICINYGSRFTNNKDLELLQTYTEHFFNPDLIINKNYNLSSSADFPYPLLDDSLFEKFKNTNSTENTNTNRSDYYLRMLHFKDEALKLKQEQPEVFGLHFNAEISSQIKDNLELLDSIRILNHDLVASAESKSTEEIVLNKIKFAREKLPKPLESDKKKFEMIISDDSGGASGDKSKNYNPIHILLYQEAVKYNKLLEIITIDLTNFEKALLGHITLTPQIMTSLNQISEDKLPVEWLCFYLSTKSFIHFIDDLNKRFDFFRMWIGNGLYTPSYHLGYFTNPTSFITAIKQRYSLMNKVAYNNITLQFKVCNDNEDKALKNTNGYIIQGIEIEGGYWDKKNMGIRDECVQELTNELPNIIITPTASDDRVPNFGANALLGEAVVEVTRNFPLYYIPIRGDYLGRNSYIMDITLNIVREKDKEGLEKSREEILSYWIKKGTCLFLSKSD